MTFNLDELRETVSLMRELERIADKVLPMLELLNAAGEKNIIVPPVTDRLVERGTVAKILKLGSVGINHLIQSGQLTPLYIANSNNMKFLLSEVEQILSDAHPQRKRCRLTKPLRSDSP